MRKTNKGSALLITLLITTFLSALLFSSWWRSSLLVDVVHTREHFYQTVLINEALLTQTISWAKKHFNALLSQKNKVSLVQLEKQNDALLARMLPKRLSGHAWRSAVTIEPFVMPQSKKATCVAICIQLYCDDSVLQKLSCLLTRKKRNNENDQNKKQSFVLLEFFTLGAT